MIVAIDFDGTIIHGAFPNIDGLIKGAKEYINYLYDEGHYIIINTCRSGEQLLNAINYLLQQGVKFHRVNDNEPENSAKYKSNSRKIYAHVYVDDKQVGGLPSWYDIYMHIKEKDKEYNSQKVVPNSIQHPKIAENFLQWLEKFYHDSMKNSSEHEKKHGYPYPSLHDGYKKYLEDFPESCNHISIDEFERHIHNHRIFGKHYYE